MLLFKGCNNLQAIFSLEKDKLEFNTLKLNILSHFLFDTGFHVSQNDLKLTT